MLYAVSLKIMLVKLVKEEGRSAEKGANMGRRTSSHEDRTSGEEGLKGRLETCRRWLKTEHMGGTRC